MAGDPAPPDVAGCYDGDGDDAVGTDRAVGVPSSLPRTTMATEMGIDMAAPEQRAAPAHRRGRHLPRPQGRHAPLGAVLMGVPLKNSDRGH
ncbi:MAG TPA: hypothetical protein VFG00_13680 [Acidothermaceae bacterium]|nr:hypothetical protein [Acidothermaceae bacterium]